MKKGAREGPPIRSKMGPIGSKVEAERRKFGPFWDVVFHENTSSKGWVGWSQRGQNPQKKRAFKIHFRPF